MEAARVATEADVPRIVELARQAAAALQEQRGGPLWTLREGRLEPLDAGFAAARWETLRDGSRHAVVDELYVEPEGRGVAVGEVLMDSVLEWCEAAGCAGVDAVALPGDRETKNFFERFGLTARAIIVHRRLVDGDATDAEELT